MVKPRFKAVKNVRSRIGRRPLTPGAIRERCAAMAKVLSGCGMKRSEISYLVVQNCISPEKAASRLARLKEAKIPLTGLVSKIGQSEPKFKALIARYDKLRGVKTGFTERQANVFDYLRSKLVSQKVVLELAKRQFLPDIKKKIAFFESQKLNPNLYGVERIPVSCFEARLGFNLDNAKRKGLNAVLRKLKREHSIKMLDLFLPGWKKSKNLKRVGPSTLLERVKTALAMGIKPSSKIPHKYSAKAIRLGKATTPHSLDKERVKAHIVRFGDRKWNRIRLLIVDAMTSRPHLSVSRVWLENYLQKSHGITRDIFLNRLEELSDWGILISKAGYITIGPWYRKAKTA